MSQSSVGIVVPTLGTRPDFLIECLTSIRGAGNAHILVVAPESADLLKAESLGLVNTRVVDPGKGLPSAINHGLASLPENVRYVNWLGDDDKLLNGALEVAEQVLERDLRASYVYGGCNYIDIKGRILMTNNSGNWARPLLRFGPDLVPQPGALIRRDSLEKIGGLDSRYGWAFDLEMFIQLGKIGRGRFVNQVLAEFRWHDGSLTVGARDGSSMEAKAIRKAHLPPFLRPLAPIWEVPFKFIGEIAAGRLSAAAKK